METIRCGKCHRLLAKAQGGVIEIKCPRCGTLNHVTTLGWAPTTAATHPPEPAGAESNLRGLRTAERL